MDRDAAIGLARRNYRNGPQGVRNAVRQLTGLETVLSDFGRLYLAEAKAVLAEAA